MRRADPDSALSSDGHALEGAELKRLREDASGTHDWKRWGPYLAERQWGTVREDYSSNGDVWGHFTHDQARSRAYRWGEDGLLGLTDRNCRLCFALALWNGADPILKERLFGLSNAEGNHGEDVKERYYYLDATPTHSYQRARYDYPHAAFPYQQLIAENAARSRSDPEFELEDTGIFAEQRYFEITVEYAKASPEDILIVLTVVNRGPEPAHLHLLPTLWLRNTWSWGRTGESYPAAGELSEPGLGVLAVRHPALADWQLEYESTAEVPQPLFTNNETNFDCLYGAPNHTPWTKDAFHRRVVQGVSSATNPDQIGTKACLWYQLPLAPSEKRSVHLRLRKAADGLAHAFGDEFVATLQQRREEATEFHTQVRSSHFTPEEANIARQADAGLLTSKQFYHYIVEHWLEGDPAFAAPGSSRRSGRNSGWRDLYAHDVISMPDKWEYPWFAAWDLAFHCVALARVDAALAKEQLLLLTGPRYLDKSGDVPAYEFGFSEVNPPLLAWAAWRVYQLDASASGHGDRGFLSRAFHKALVNFTWWVNRKDADGDNLYSGGFLGLDNIGVFDRDQLLPGVGRLEQADATAWMAFYATTMLAMALELAHGDGAYGDLASTFFEHFLGVAQAMNALGGAGLWDEADGFYYDQALIEGRAQPLRIRSVVGLVPLLAAETIEEAQLRTLPDFARRLSWYLESQPELARHVASVRLEGEECRRLLAIPSRDRLVRVLRYLLDESEFLSEFGIRSLSKVHEQHPFIFHLAGVQHQVAYAPGPSDSAIFGGNSNWRGPIWVPLNYLIIEALKRHHHFHGDSLRVECPTGSGVQLTLLQVAEHLEQRLARLFLRRTDGTRPWQSAAGSDNGAGASSSGAQPGLRSTEEPPVLFHEYFHGDLGLGLGASHQTGWTALIANVLERVAEVRAAQAADITVQRKGGCA